MYKISTTHNATQSLHNRRNRYVVWEKQAYNGYIFKDIDPDFKLFGVEICGQHELLQRIRNNRAKTIAAKSLYEDRG